MRSLLDGASIGLSAACLVHCLALPILAATLPALADILETPEWTHVVLLALALPLSLTALLAGYRRHGRVVPLLVGLSGLTALAAGVAFEHIRLAEVGLTVAGAVLLALAHLRNWRYMDGCRANAAAAGA
jgi:hypothetical protein